MTDRDAIGREPDLLISIWERVDRYASRGDHSGVLERTAVAEADDLLAGSPGSRTGRVVLSAVAGYLLAWLHWYRYVARFPASDSDDLARARDYFDGIRAAKAEMVPAGIDRYLSGGLAEPPTGERPDRVWVLTQLSGDLVNRYLGSGTADDLDVAVSMGREAVRLMRTSEPERSANLSNLSIALRTRFTHDQANVADINDAVDLAHQALASAPEGYKHSANLWSNLGRCLYARYGHAEDLRDLSGAIAAFRRSLELTPPGEATPVFRLYMLWTALRLRHDAVGDIDDLMHAIAAGQQVVAGIDDPGIRLRYLRDLSADLRKRAAWTRAPADIEDALTAANEVVAGITDDDPLRAAALSTRGHALLARHRRGGELADLDNAVRDHRDAVTCAGPDDADVETYLDRLATALHDRFRQTGDLEDLSEAINHRRQTIRESPRDDAAGANNLAIALYARYERTRSVVDLDDAIAIAREALDGTSGGGPSRASLLCCLAVFLGDRFRHNDDITSLRDAVACAREAVSITAADAPDRAARLSTLCNALWLLAVPGGDTAAADQAIDAAREATTMFPLDHPDRGVTLVNLGHALMVRAQLTGDPADLPEAARVLQTAAGQRSARPLTRMRAAASWAGMETLTGGLESAMEAFATANGLLPLLAWPGLGREIREENLVQFSSVARQAAASAIAANRPELAVELLEQGRALIWGQTLHTRSDLTALHEVAPDLATRMEGIRTELGGQDDPPHPPGPPAGPTDRETAGPRYRRLTEEWEELLVQARSIEGFADLLAPTPFSRLRQAADRGPVIMVNVAPFRCDALIVTVDGVRIVPLPDLNDDDAQRMAVAFLDTTRGTPREPRDIEPRASPGAPTTRSVLSWLWDTVARPVLDALGYDRPPPDIRDWPRVWWCPTGPLSALPLHAAGRYSPSHGSDIASPAAIGADVAPSSVNDRVISSYTPTIGALLRAQAPRRSVPAQRGRLLSVGMVTTPATPNRPAMSPLPAVSPELDRVVAHWPATRLLSPPLATAEAALATRDAVLEALASHQSVHLACHGVQDHARPAASAIHLVDGMLTAVDLANLTLPNAELAFLSACATATGTSRLPDESIHLSAALQVAGFRHVVATLWPIRDDLAPELADAFFEYLTRDGPPRPLDAHLALHYAVTKLRRRNPEPWLWAPYIHVGP